MKMEEVILKKWQNLDKFLPLIEYLINIFKNEDKEKYAKFKKIKKWIIERTRFDTNSINKIEKSIITQYRNLAFSQHKVPDDIASIFRPSNETIIELSSDEEEAPPKDQKLSVAPRLEEIVISDDEKCEFNFTEHLNEDMDFEKLCEVYKHFQMYNGIDLEKCLQENWPQKENEPIPNQDAAEMHQSSRDITEQLIKQKELPIQMNLNINLKDPRIMKLLKVLADSPLCPPNIRQSKLELIRTHTSNNSNRVVKSPSTNEPLTNNDDNNNKLINKIEQEKLANSEKNSNQFLSSYTKKIQKQVENSQLISKSSIGLRKTYNNKSQINDPTTIKHLDLNQYRMSAQNLPKNSENQKNSNQGQRICDYSEEQPTINSNNNQLLEIGSQQEENISKISSNESYADHTTIAKSLAINATEHENYESCSEKELTSRITKLKEADIQLDSNKTYLLKQPTNNPENSNEAREPLLTSRGKHQSITSSENCSKKSSIIQEFNIRKISHSKPLRCAYKYSKKVLTKSNAISSIKQKLAKDFQKPVKPAPPKNSLRYKRKPSGLALSTFTSTVEPILKEMKNASPMKSKIDNSSTKSETNTSIVASSTIINKKSEIKQASMTKDNSNMVECDLLKTTKRRIKSTTDSQKSRKIYTKKTPNLLHSKRKMSIKQRLAKDFEKPKKPAPPKYSNLPSTKLKSLKDLGVSLKSDPKNIVVAESASSIQSDVPFVLLNSVKGKNTDMVSFKNSDIIQRSSTSESLAIAEQFVESVKHDELKNQSLVQINNLLKRRAKACAQPTQASKLNRRTELNSIAAEGDCRTIKKKSSGEQCFKQNHVLQQFEITYRNKKHTNSPHSLSSKTLCHEAIDKILRNQPVVLVQRLREKDFLEVKNDLMEKDKNKVNYDESIHLLESVKEKSEITIYNTDIHMTEDNTKICVLCKRKSTDLTSHFCRFHKTESYVSRLDSKTLELLQINIPFAEQWQQDNNTIMCKITCIFCKKSINDEFINLHNHFSSHTGEFAFQCSGCKLQKPYYTDIQYHLTHAKNCKCASIKTLYQYPRNLMVIYLYSCKICNFVQLNEENIYKHLREHHQKHRKDPELVEKHILAALRDSVEHPETEKYCSMGNVADEGVIVEHEYIWEDAFLDNKPKQEPKAEDNSIENENINNLELEHINKIGSSLPMTIVHYPIKSMSSHFESNSERSSCAQSDDSSTVTALKNSIKNKQISSPVKADGKSVHYLYKSFPSNVSFYGLYKCMADNCYFSTNKSDEFVQHLHGHSETGCSPREILNCPYCRFNHRDFISAYMLIEHIQNRHYRSCFQCLKCSYRSCAASNTLNHINKDHSNVDGKIFVYKCLDVPPEDDECLTNKLTDAMVTNVRILECEDCPFKCYALDTMKNHVSDVHCRKIDNKKNKIYACIYCETDIRTRENVLQHLAQKHPDEVPYACKRVLKSENKIDALRNLVLKDFNIIVPSALIKTATTVTNNNNSIEGNCELATNTNNHEPTISDISSQMDLSPCDQDEKPSTEQLINIQMETLKPLLRKVTQSTGIPLDRLYCCPVEKCGGFFSNYDLWKRHMETKHHALLTKCPHCPEELSIFECREHLEKHQQHTYLCYHCDETFRTIEEISMHTETLHKELGESRLETINFNMHYSYFISIAQREFNNHLNFYIEVTNLLRERWQKKKDLEVQNVLKKWIVPPSSRILDTYGKLFADVSDKVKRCFFPSCKVVLKTLEELFSHMRTHSEKFKCSLFTCYKCKEIIKDFRTWEQIEDHIRMHDDNSHICSICDFNHYNGQAMSSHVKMEHNIRDVPIVRLQRCNGSIYFSISIIFASGRRSFSTLSKCFLCHEQNLSMENFALHLKKSHNLTMDYFCDWCNKNLLKLHESNEHFQKEHPNEKLKIRCELGAKNQLILEDVRPLRLSTTVNIQNPLKLSIKQEQTDENLGEENDVIDLGDDDVAIVEDCKAMKVKPSESVPQIRCANINKLLVQNITTEQTNSAGQVKAKATVLNNNDGKGGMCRVSQISVAQPPLAETMPHANINVRGSRTIQSTAAAQYSIPTLGSQTSSIPFQPVTVNSNIATPASASFQNDYYPNYASHRPVIIQNFRNTSTSNYVQSPGIAFNNNTAGTNNETTRLPPYSTGVNLESIQRNTNCNVRYPHPNAAVSSMSITRSNTQSAPVVFTEHRNVNAQSFPARASTYTQNSNGIVSSIHQNQINSYGNTSYASSHGYISKQSNPTSSYSSQTSSQQLTTAVTINTNQLGTSTFINRNVQITPKNANNCNNENIQKKHGSQTSYSSGANGTYIGSIASFNSYSKN